MHFTCIISFGQKEKEDSVNGKNSGIFWIVTMSQKKGLNLEWRCLDINGVYAWFSM